VVGAIAEAGDRVKTDRRDASMLDKLDRSRELTPIWIPGAAYGAMRDPMRAGDGGPDIVEGTTASAKLLACLLRHDQIYRGVHAWTPAYRRWLTAACFAHPARQIVLKHYIHAVQDDEARLDRLTRQIKQPLSNWVDSYVVTAH
jgi:transposase